MCRDVKKSLDFLKRFKTFFLTLEIKAKEKKRFETFLTENG